MTEQTVVLIMIIMQIINTTIMQVGATEHQSVITCIYVPQLTTFLSVFAIFYE